MPLFYSRRERRLWVYALATVAAVYSTLGLAATLAEEMRDRGLIDAAFVFGFLLVLATILSLGLSWRPSGIELGAALGVAAVYILVFVRMTIPVEERTHLVEYGVLSVFIYEALKERARRGSGGVRFPAPLAVTVSALVGTLDEGVQAYMPERTFDSRDIFFNLLASVMAVSASSLLGWARRRGERVN